MKVSRLLNLGLLVVTEALATTGELNLEKEFRELANYDFDLDSMSYYSHMAIEEAVNWLEQHDISSISECFGYYNGNRVDTGKLQALVAKGHEFYKISDFFKSGMNFVADVVELSKESHKFQWWKHGFMQSLIRLGTAELFDKVLTENFGVDLNEIMEIYRDFEVQLESVDVLGTILDAPTNHAPKGAKPFPWNGPSDSVAVPNIQPKDSPWDMPTDIPHSGVANEDDEFNDRIDDDDELDDDEDDDFDFDEDDEEDEQEPSEAPEEREEEEEDIVYPSCTATITSYTSAPTDVDDSSSSTDDEDSSTDDCHRSHDDEDSTSTGDDDEATSTSDDQEGTSTDDEGPAETGEDDEGTSTRTRHRGDTTVTKTIIITETPKPAGSCEAPRMTDEPDTESDTSETESDNLTSETASEDQPAETGTEDQPNETATEDQPGVTATEEQPSETPSEDQPNEPESTCERPTATEGVNEGEPTSSCDQPSTTENDEARTSAPEAPAPEEPSTCENPTTTGEQDSESPTSEPECSSSSEAPSITEDLGDQPTSAPESTCENPAITEAPETEEPVGNEPITDSNGSCPFRDAPMTESEGSNPDQDGSQETATATDNVIVTESPSENDGPSQTQTEAPTETDPGATEDDEALEEAQREAAEKDPPVDDPSVTQLPDPKRIEAPSPRLTIIAPSPIEGNSDYVPPTDSESQESPTPAPSPVPSPIASEPEDGITSTEELQTTETPTTEASSEPYVAPPVTQAKDAIDSEASQTDGNATVDPTTTAPGDEAITSNSPVSDDVKPTEQPTEVPNEPAKEEPPKEEVKDDSGKNDPNDKVNEKDTDKGNDTLPKDDSVQLPKEEESGQSTLPLPVTTTDELTGNPTPVDILKPEYSNSTQIISNTPAPSVSGTDEGTKPSKTRKKWRMTKRPTITKIPELPPFTTINMNFTETIDFTFTSPQKHISLLSSTKSTKLQKEKPTQVPKESTTANESKTDVTPIEEKITSTSTTKETETSKESKTEIVPASIEDKTTSTSQPTSIEDNPESPVPTSLEDKPASSLAPTLIDDKDAPTSIDDKPAPTSTDDQPASSLAPKSTEDKPAPTSIEDKPAPTSNDDKPVPTSNDDKPASEAPTSTEDKTTTPPVPTPTSASKETSSAKESKTSVGSEEKPKPTKETKPSDNTRKDSPLDWKLPPPARSNQNFTYPIVFPPSGHTIRMKDRTKFPQTPEDLAKPTPINKPIPVGAIEQRNAAENEMVIALSSRDLPVETDGVQPEVGSPGGAVDQPNQLQQKPNFEAAAPAGAKDLQNLEGKPQTIVRDITTDEIPKYTRTGPIEPEHAQASASVTSTIVATKPVYYTFNSTFPTGRRLEKFYGNRTNGTFVVDTNITNKATGLNPWSIVSGVIVLISSALLL
ncbi:HCL499Cp [Eremothecium sinecaudum]|uniref:HCL499Cp n=1 Tax=Eremothecium sinecaudum TaxID=45286 RepID=A0A120K1R6_9SACH|nr:HCL499Cp [Eremothecium sinecaudum]AMD19652.1 HCL499Cp [Eremothecium sinecaudum]